ncbi:MAG TPA: efflux RND transporter periplasmic adaptor subunit [Candidatus Koribacter sp.]|jgi:multidrug efflux system membrane fusion protein
MSDRLVTPETPTSKETPPEETHRGRWLIFIVIFVLVAAAAWYFHDRSASQAKSQRPGGGRGNFGDRPVPASVAQAAQGNMPVYVEALGTVTPVYTVTVTSRVQGQIVAVHYREGQNVQKGDPLLDIDPRPYEAALTQAEGQLARDKALLQEAEIDLKRYQSALARNAIAQQTVQDQEQVVHQDEGVVKNDEGLVASANVNLVYCHITSPIGGRVGLRLVDPGNIVQANSTTSLVVVTQVVPITVIFSVAEDYLPQIQAETKNGRKMEVDALSRLDQPLAKGTLMSLDNQVDTTTGTIKLRAEFPNKDGELFPNQFVNAKLLLNTIQNTTLIPTQAIQQSPNGPYVYVVTDGAAKMRQIKQGPANGTDTSVSGVNPGETVITSGFDKIQEGSKVNTGGPGGQGTPQNTNGSGPKPATGTNPQQAPQSGRGQKPKQ